MKICQITPGLIPIPALTWGAVEKIIWSYFNHLTKLGHQVDIKFYNEVQPGQYDIVHSHLAEQSIDLSNRGVKNILHIHDHHAVLWGKDSFCYKQHAEAIQKSLITLVPAEYLVDYFENPYKVFFAPHAVENSLFKPAPIRKEHKFLCVANNGYINDLTYDRKGFRLAVEIAKFFNLPITIAGPTKNNKLFFETNADLLNYEKLNIVYDPLDPELIKLYQDHSIFLHFSELEAGQPNLTIHESLSMGLPVVGTFKGCRDLPGLFRVNRDLNEGIKGVQQVINNYSNFYDLAVKTGQLNDYSNRVNDLLTIYNSLLNIKNKFDTPKFTKSFIDVYENIKIQDRAPLTKPVNKLIVNFINGAFVEITGPDDIEYKIDFKNKETGEILYTTTLKTNHWARTSFKYFIDYQIDIKNIKTGELIQQYNYNAENRRVYIHIDSKALGDTLAWFPYIEEFRKKHNCKIICSCFWRELFEKEYLHFEFVNPGTEVNGLYAMYTVGLFKPEDKFSHIRDPRTISLQQIAGDFLGIDKNDIPPAITIKDKTRQIKEKYVCISTHATAECKLWTNPTGWQDVIDFLNDKGYKVILIQKERNDTLHGLIKPTDKDIHNSINLLYNSEFFIGIGSGVSWLAWSLGKKVVMISGFSEEFTEFNCVRIINKNVCYGCWNDLKCSFSPSEWFWCPRNKNFECTKAITSERVIKEIENNNLIICDYSHE